MNKLKFKMVLRQSLVEDQVIQMYDLMKSNYQKVKFSVFEKDLQSKEWVLLFQTEEMVIKGFTTLVLNPKKFNHPKYNVLFSGDTIIDHDYWGSMELMKGFCFSAGYVSKIHSKKKLYWLLTSKGYSTYLFLRLYAKIYYPQLERSNPILKNLIEKIAPELYPEVWDDKSGILKHQSSDGCLKATIAGRSELKLKNPHVNFFLNKNPNFKKGHELVCMTELCETNLKRSAKNWFIEGKKFTGF